MPEDALNALTQSTAVKEPLLMNSKDCERVLAEFIDAGIDLDGLAADLQDAGTKSVVNSWNVLIAVLESKAAVLNKGRTLRPTS
jgi:transaldolase